MKKSKVRLNFVKLSNPEKIQFYKNVITCLTNNASFTSPDVELWVLKEKVLAFEKDYMETLTGNRWIYSAIIHSKKEVDDAFRTAALYVERIANGNLALILESGFYPTKQSGPYKKESFEAKTGKEPRTILLTGKAIQGAKAYLWQYSVEILPEHNKDWLLAGASTQTQFKMIDLDSGSKCWFRRAPITTKGIGPWSNPVMKVVP